MASKIDDITLTKQSNNVLTLISEGKYFPDDKFFNISVQSSAGIVTTSDSDVEAVDDSETRNIIDVIGTKSTSVPVSSYYIKLNATGTGSTSVTTAGWVNSGTIGTGEATNSFYYPIDSAAVTLGSPSVDASGLVTTTLGITAGYVPATSDSSTLQLSTKAAETYPFSTLAGATIPAGKYLTGDQTILQAYTSGISASNIKYGETVEVGDTESHTRIHNVTGTFTKADTVSSGQTAAAAAQIRSGYSAWVDGSEVEGSMGNAAAAITGTNTVTPTASVAGTNVTLSNTNNGISVTATGGGSASASLTATCSTTGYAAANDVLCTNTIAGASQSTTASSYISGVTLTKPSSGTRTFSVTVPNGSSTATFTFNVDSSGNVTVTES